MESIKQSSHKFSPRRLAITIVVLALIGGGAMYLYTAPREGSPCVTGQGVKTDPVGTPLTCLVGTWREAAAEDWHMHGPLTMSALIEKLLPKDWKVDWRANENPVMDTEAAWRAGFMMHAPVRGDRVTYALLDAAQYGFTPYLVACWNTEKRVIVIDHEGATGSFKDCKR